ncbi:DUF1489 family protein [Marivita sp. S2033]|uniref:DUF1489 family protein n=1 Tax=Marivita sp. S2033 TaxID=3373187 RepID=UPI0039829878
MSDHINLIKLSVGSDSVEQMEDWQKNRSRQRRDGQYYHLTRMWPKREAELVNGGSIYWVVKGFLQARQRIIRLDEMIGDDGIRRCAIVLDSEIIRTSIAPKRPFQGWRYLKPEDAPVDLGKARQNDDALPAELAGALAEIGVF